MTARLSPQQQRVYDLIARHPAGLTDEEGTALSGLPRFGRIRHELKVRGLVATTTPKPHIWKVIA